MHELSIAINIAELIEEELEQRKGMTVDTVTLEIGSLSGVVTEALRFAMEEVKTDSVLKDANIVYLEKEGIASCEACGNKYPVKDFFDPCPECNHPYSEIIQGEELRIKSITLK